MNVILKPPEVHEAIIGTCKRKIRLLFASPFLSSNQGSAYSIFLQLLMQRRPGDTEFS